MAYAQNSTSGLEGVSCQKPGRRKENQTVGGVPMSEQCGTNILLHDDVSQHIPQRVTLVKKLERCRMFCRSGKLYFCRKGNRTTLLVHLLQ